MSSADCLMCGEPFTAWSDRRPMGTEDGPREAHAECLLLHTVGHHWGVCSCTGYGKDHGAALELLRRIRMG
jgi:hypothetical protein